MSAIRGLSWAVCSLLPTHSPIVSFPAWLKRLLLYRNWAMAYFQPGIESPLQTMVSGLVNYGLHKSGKELTCGTRGRMRKPKAWSRWPFMIWFSKVTHLTQPWRMKSSVSGFLVWLGEEENLTLSLISDDWYVEPEKTSDGWVKQHTQDSNSAYLFTLRFHFSPWQLTAKWGERREENSCF